MVTDLEQWVEEVEHTLKETRIKATFFPTRPKRQDEIA